MGSSHCDWYCHRNSSLLILRHCNLQCTNFDLQEAHCGLHAWEPNYVSLNQTTGCPWLTVYDSINHNSTHSPCVTPSLLLEGAVSLEWPDPFWRLCHSGCRNLSHDKHPVPHFRISQIFIAVYEDGNGVAYTDGISGSGSKLKASVSMNAMRRFNSPKSPPTAYTNGWDGEDDPIITKEADNVGRGLEIYKTVDLNMQDEYRNNGEEHCSPGLKSVITGILLAKRISEYTKVIGEEPGARYPSKILSTRSKGWFEEFDVHGRGQHNREWHYGYSIS